MRSHFMLCGLLGLTHAVPTPTTTLVERDEISDALNDLNEASTPGANSGIEQASDVLTRLDVVKPTTQPSTPEQAIAAIKDILAPEASSTPNVYAAVGQMIANGLTVDDAQSARGASDSSSSSQSARRDTTSSGPNSFSNVNTRNPASTIYPRADGFADAPYTQSEATLRAAIHIPSSFQYGARGAPAPIIFVPGTGSTGYLTFAGNYIKQLQGSNIADPVWLNIPEFALGDVQTNAEFVAYAVNYIYGISNQSNVSVATWSQGSIMGQWAYKYWPSARSRVSDQIAFSPDYHGTVEANVLSFGGLFPLPPSVLQQEYDSKFIGKLRSNGGDSAYVPTTNVYSSFLDEIVEPQGGDLASGRLLDARGVGATNAEVQKVCPGQPAGGFYDHETTMVNPIGYALLVDALSHDGPGKLERIDLGSVCRNTLSPGIGLDDLLATQNNLLIALAQILSYPSRSTQEPAIRDFA